MTWTITTTTTISASRAVTLAERIPSEPIKFIVLHPGTGAGGTVTIWDDLGRSVASTRIDALSPRHEAEFFSDRSIFNVSAAIDGNATLSGAGVSVYLVSREAPEPSIADGSTSFAGSLKVAEGVIYPTPEDFFGTTPVPAGWLETMIAAGVRKISLTERRYPFPLLGASRNVTVDDLVIIGAKRPTVNGTLTALNDDGTVVEGGFQFLGANRIQIRDLGVDRGDVYVAGGGSGPANGEIIFSQGSDATVDNVITVGRSAGRAIGSHALLSQGCPKTAVTRSEFIHGMHGLALKSDGVIVDQVIVRKAIMAVTLKSDTVAIGSGYRCANTRITNSRFLSLGDASGGFGISVGTGSAVAEGQDLSDIFIDAVHIEYDTYASAIPNSGLSITSQVDGGQIDRFVVGAIVIKNSTFAIDIPALSLDPLGIQLGNVHVDRASRAVIHTGRAASRPIQIGNLYVYAAVGAVQLDASADIIIGNIEYVGGSTQVMTLMSTTPRFRVGSYRSTLRPFFNSTVTTYSNSCTDYTGDGTTPLRLSMTGGAFALRGKIVPGTADAQTDYALFSVPAWAYPGSKRTFSVPAIVGGAVQMLALDVSTAGVFSIKSLPASTTYISMDGVAWEPGL